jgi:antitoxin (DNA-binding transcriptional repressor) of toxin-antitoxin stability system
MISAKTSEFKARLAHYMGLVRKGREVVVKDRDTPVARLVPYRADADPKPLVILPRDPTAPRLGEIQVQGVAVANANSLSLLLEDRSRR